MPHAELTQAMQQFRSSDSDVPWVDVPDIPELKAWLDKNAEKKKFHQNGAWQCRKFSDCMHLYNQMLTDAGLRKYCVSPTDAGEQVRVLVHSGAQRCGFSIQLNFGLPFEQYASGEPCCLASRQS